MEFVLSELCQQVMAARGAERPVYIQGGGTKRFYGENLGPDPIPGTAVLDMSGYAGIVSYEPSELVMTVRAGTLLSDVEAALDEQNQMLAFEPPRFGPTSTIGGCVASGLSGPRRMAAGSVRDFVLGAKLLDSSGVVLSFGGEVMKNVAGYDISRLLAGSMGIFGAMIEVSLKVVPKPFQEKTFRLELDQDQALDLFGTWRGLPIPISATAWVAEPGQAGVLYARVSGSAPAVTSAAERIGGDTLPDAEAQSFWSSLRDQTHSFFQHRPLWRLAVPPQTPALNLGPTLIEWNGGLRWVSEVESAAGLRDTIAQQGGHATLYRYEHKPHDTPVFHPLSPGLKNISLRLKQELDPTGIFNPKRLFPDF
ncbi:glycolate oxidase subunit GlcE [Pollutimonas harenae]|uniref:Glycolate oxidase subunit GlcE n=1 Tax=Pollutimonas harenae TaxID=657015 RepID=A0A853H1L2_9BURK|nr:glycolate oxidase subunit GlcE [Pollutimonas harenae]NYT85669.1 glycolate oxidase subunit GlcE [Pollutimonas harenae]TEA70744.1 glycolate oxidase subunit GlcE [Pollutimonas harenae]